MHERQITKVDATESGRLKHTRRVLIYLGVIGVGALLIVFAAYFFNFGHEPLSKEQSHWGVFGDFVGGTLNPMFGFLTVIGLLWTIYQNQYELSQTRKEFAATRDIADKQERRMERQERKDENFRMIRAISDELDAILQFGGTRRFAEVGDYGNFKVSVMAFTTIDYIHFLLDELHDYMHAYNTLAGDKFVTAHFAHKFKSLARAVHQHKPFVDVVIYMYAPEDDPNYETPGQRKTS